MKRVIIESPFKATTKKQSLIYKKYLKDCIKNSLSRGEAPFASHGFYTEVLDDSNPEERKQGMEAGFAWGEVADLVAVYVDYGISDGMRLGLNRAQNNFIHIEFRNII